MRIIHCNVCTAYLDHRWEKKIIFNKIHKKDSNNFFVLIELQSTIEHLLLVEKCWNYHIFPLSVGILINSSIKLSFSSLHQRIITNEPDDLWLCNSVPILNFKVSIWLFNMFIKHCLIWIVRCVWHCVCMKLLL